VLKRRLADRIHAMPVPGVLDISTDEWKPSDPWIRKLTGVDLSVRRPQDKFYIFRIG
jgi:hypothetical protein